MADLTFYPSGLRAAVLDRTMRSELAKSLAQLCTQFETQLPSSEVGLHIHKIQTVISALDEQERIAPAVFATYYQLVFSLLNEDNNYPERVDDLVSSVEHKQHLSFRDFSVMGLGNEKRVSLYLDCLNTDQRLNFEFLPPTYEESRRTQASVLRGLALMQRVAPAMVAEFTSIVSEVVLASGSRQANEGRFDGASSYMLWGALIMNVNDEKSDLEMMEALAHESAHSFLFGLTIDEPLTFNPDNEVYDSPLRNDARPIEGIYHATYVSARMHYAMNKARKSGVLNDMQRQECTKYLVASRKAFFDGHKVVTEKGKLSPSGDKIMAYAHRYMHEFSYA